MKKRDLTELPDYCEGFLFTYYRADPRGYPVKTTTNKIFKEAEEKILRRVNQVLKNRPDVMEQLACLDNALEIRLYQGTDFKDRDDELYFFGRATVEGDEVVLELSTDEVLHGGQVCDEVLDVVVHELMHVIDLIDEMDGLLPGLSESAAEQYIKAREKEKTKIRCGKSPMVGYALTNDVEFLGVLAETFFVRPEALYASNKTLYNTMKRFFKQDPLSEKPG